VQVFNTQQNTLYRRAFISINITQLCKHMMSQFDDRLIIGYGKTMTGLKKIEFHNPNAAADDDDVDVVGWLVTRCILAKRFATYYRG